MFTTAHPWSRYPFGDDLRVLAERGATVGHCPYKYAKMAMTLHSFQRYVDAGVNVAIGTDTFPMDMVSELRWASILAKVTDANYQVGLPRDVYNAATLAACKFLRRDDLGRLAPGAKADILLITLDHLGGPVYADPIKALVEAGCGRDVDTVIVDGKILDPGRSHRPRRRGRGLREGAGGDPAPTGATCPAGAGTAPTSTRSCPRRSRFIECAAERRSVDVSVAAKPSRRFAALHSRDYRRYFTFSLVSMTADNIEHVISYWVIFQAFHSPSLAGFAVISHWVPFLLFSVYAGALADRYDCRRLIQISQGLFMLASLAWGVLFLAGALRMWHAVVILLVHGCAGVIATPAVQLIVHDIVGAEQLPSAIRLNATSRYLAILLGPGGGWRPDAAARAGVGSARECPDLSAADDPAGAPPLHRPHAPAPARRGGRAFGLGEALRLFAEVRSDRRVVTMIAARRSHGLLRRQCVPGPDAGVCAPPRHRRGGRRVQRAPRGQRRGRGHRRPAARKLEPPALRTRGPRSSAPRPGQ